MSYKVTIHKKSKAKNFLVALLNLNGFTFRNIGVTAFSVYAKDKKTLEDQVKSFLPLYEKTIYCRVQLLPVEKIIRGVKCNLYKVVVLSVETEFENININDQFSFVSWTKFPDRIAEGKFDSKNREKLVRAFGNTLCVRKSKNFNRFKVRNLFITVLKNTIVVD